MKTQTVLVASFIALLVTVPAYAYSQATHKPESTGLGYNFRIAQPRMEQATLIERDAGPPNRVIAYDAKRTAEGMIGETLRDSQDKKLATVKDIIMGSNGVGLIVVAKTGGLLGVGGKLKALDYRAAVATSQAGDSLTTVTQIGVDSAPEFTYKPMTTSNVRGMPDNSLSAVRLLSGKLLNDRGDSVARINDITLNNGIADKLIVSHLSLTHFAGTKVAMNYGALQPVQKNSALDLQMDRKLSARFEAFMNNQTVSRQ